MTTPDDGFNRRVIRLLALVVGLTGGLWGTTLLITGGFDVTVFGWLVRSHNPMRPFTVGALGTLVFMAAGAPTHWPWRGVLSVSPTAHHGLAIALAVSTCCVGLTYATTVAGGSDSYGYISQADRWLGSPVKIDQAWARNVPWPLANWTFTPLGYHPSEIPNESWVITPIYSPGLPLMMAAAKRIGGQEAMFWVVPLMGAVLVLATYGIGCRLASPTCGLIGAWLIATSPAVLFELMEPMTDVPAAGAWALAFYFLLGHTALRASLAGLAVAVAILIRPNLVVGAIVVASWYGYRMARAGTDARRQECLLGIAFSVGVLPGIAATALINTTLNGSPWRSGYGALGYLFAFEHFWPNLRDYVAWLVDSQTPLALAGVAAMVVPLKRLWPVARDRSVFLAINGFVLVIWVMYGFFLRVDVWWYLRYLLPSWPFIMVGMGAIIVAFTRSASLVVRLVVTSLVIALGVREVGVAADRRVFERWKEDRHYVSVAHLVRSRTEENSVILSMHYSGSLRYYAGRLTLRFDQLDGRWLDRTVSWLADRGVHPYLLANTLEIPDVTSRFAGQRTLEQLEQPPVFVYQGPTTVVLYDLSRPKDGASIHAPPIIQETYKNLRSIPPVSMLRPALD